MSRPAKKKAAPKKKAPSKKKEDAAEKKKRGNKKKEAVTEEVEEPQAPTRLEEEAIETVPETELEPADAKREKPREIEAEIGEAEAPVEAPAEEKPVLEEEPEEEEDEGLEIVEEKFYDLNLRRIWNTPRVKRTPRAVRYIRDFVAKRMKSDEVSISEETNQLLWARGIKKPPRHVRLRVVKDKEDRVIIFPATTTPEREAKEDTKVEAVATPKTK